MTSQLVQSERNAGTVITTVPDTDRIDKTCDKRFGRAIEVLEHVEHHDQIVGCRWLERRVERADGDRAATVVGDEIGRRFDSLYD